MAKTILVVGAEGQLGSAIVEAFRATARVVGLARRDLDITVDAAVAERQLDARQLRHEHARE